MDTQTVTGEQIFEALTCDPEFVAEMPEASRPAWRKICDKMPKALADLLGVPLTAKVFAQAKLIYLKIAIEGDWLKEMLSGYPAEQLESMGGLDDLVEMSHQVMESLIDQMEGMIPGFEQMLVGMGMTEEMFFAHRKAGRFNVASLATYREGGLTLARLMTTQPNALFKNTN